MSSPVSAARERGPAGLVPADAEDARPPGPDRTPRLASRMRATGERLFVGREAELALFRSTVAGSQPFSVLYLHGPGGIGKSVLLRKFAIEAALAGRPVVEVDARSARRPEDVEPALSRVLHDDRAVLLVDGFDPAARLEGWLQAEFLPRLPLGAVVVVASRQAPEPRWTCDPDWTDALCVVRLGALPPDDASALLAARGVPPARQPAMLDFACGHPFALTVASLAESAEHRHPFRASVSAHDVPRAVLARLVGDLPSPAHRRALEVCGHVQRTTESLLRVVLGDAAPALFDWLRGLPFVESGPDGLHPHDVLRAALAADARGRDPESHEAMRVALARHLLQRVRDAPEPELPGAVDAFLHVHLRRRHAAPVHGVVREEALTARDHAAVLALAEAAEGPDQAGGTARLLARRPEAFRLYRGRTGELLGFSTWLRLAGAEEVDEDDPAAVHAWRHALRTAAPRPGEHIAVSRYVVRPAAGAEDRSGVRDLVQRRTLAEIVRSPQLSWSYLVPAPGDLPPPYLPEPAHGPLSLLQLGGRTYLVVTHDRRLQPVEAWLARGGAREEPAATRPGADLVVLTQPEFYAAVRDALRSASSPAELAASPLNRTRMVAEHGTPLQELLHEAVEALAALPQGVKYHRVVAATFLRGGRSQEAVAHRLGLPFSTYRRHLGRGVQLVGDELWRRELAAG